MPSLTETMQAKFASAILHTSAYLGQTTVLIRRETVTAVLRSLRDDPDFAFDFLMDLTCVDYQKFGASLGSAPTMATPGPLPYYMQPKRLAETWARGVAHEDFRFEVVYHLYASTRNVRLRVKTPLSASDPSVDSVTELWASADWYEREVWDMYGVRFHGHPNLKRIMMYEEFLGHPLRKDYPVRKRQPLIGPVT